MKSPLQRSLFEGSGEVQAWLEPQSVPLLRAQTALAEANIPIKAERLRDKSQTICAACEEAADCEWTAFFLKHGRVPTVNDAKKPWDYPGWLMYYRLLLEEYLEVPKRWDYWYCTVAAGHLLDEPIPRIRFTDGEIGERSEGYKLIDQWVRLVERYGEGWSSPMTVLLDWLLWGLGLSADKPSVSAELHEQLYCTINLGPLLLEPYDYLGAWIADQKGKWNPHAFFPTPHNVVEMMAQMNFADVDPLKARSLTVHDPCMGTGRMLLHCSNWSLRLSGMDIDPQVIRAAKVNGALYAPWLIRPFPESFFEKPIVQAEAKASGDPS
jgi:hypothetical protein